MKLFRHATVLALALLTCACGGDSGGGGSVASAPAPGPSPTPGPTLPIGFTPSVTPTEILLGATAALGSGNTKVLDTSQVSVGRDANGNYLVTLPVAIAELPGALRRFEFLVSDRVIDPDGTQRFLVGRSGSIFPNEKFILTIAPAGTTANPLRYTNFAYVASSLAEGFSDPGYPVGSVVAFGERTLTGDVPASGSATYSGSFETTLGPKFGIFGADDESSFAYVGQLSGHASLAIDFANKGIAGSLTGITDSTGYFTYAADNSPDHRLDDMTLSGAINSGGEISGTIAAAPGTTFTGGEWTGMFFGPQAAELGGAFLLRNTQGTTLAQYAGYFGGKKD